MLTPEQVRAIKALADIIEDTARDSMPIGAPSGVIYAALMGAGVSLQVYQSILSTMVAAGRVTVENDLVRVAA